MTANQQKWPALSCEHRVPSVVLMAPMDGDVAKIRAWSEIFTTLFDANSAQIALVGLDGMIMQTNIAWRQFGLDNGIAVNYEWIGKNYLQTCAAAAEREYPSAQQAYVGLMEVICTERPKFTLDYPCHSPVEQRWYRMWVEPQMPAVPAIVVAHYLIRSKPFSQAHSMSNSAICRFTTGDA